MMGGEAGILMYVTIVAVGNVALGYWCATKLRRRSDLPVKAVTAIQPPTDDVNSILDTIPDSQADSQPGCEPDSRANEPWEQSAEPEPTPIGDIADAFARISQTLTAFDADLLAVMNDFAGNDDQPTPDSLNADSARLDQVARDCLEGLNGAARVLKQLGGNAAQAKEQQQVQDLLDDFWQNVNLAMMDLVAQECEPETIDEFAAVLESAITALVSQWHEVRKQLDEPVMRMIAGELTWYDLPNDERDTSAVLVGRLHLDELLAQAVSDPEEPVCLAMLRIDGRQMRGTDEGWHVIGNLNIAARDALAGFAAAEVTCLRGNELVVFQPGSVEAVAEQLDEVRQAVAASIAAVADADVSLSAAVTVCELPTSCAGLLECCRQALEASGSSGQVLVV